MQSITHLMSCEGIYNFPHGTVEIGKNESFVAINTTENSYFLQGDEATRFIEDKKMHGKMFLEIGYFRRYLKDLLKIIKGRE